MPGRIWYIRNAHDDVLNDAGARLEAELLGLVRRHPQHRGGAVGDLRGVARGVDAAFDDGLQRRERLEVGVADALILFDQACFAAGLAVVAQDRGLDGQDLPLEAALGPRRGGLLLGGQAEAVHVLARDAAIAGDALRGGELIWRRIPRPVGRLEERKTFGQVGQTGKARQTAGVTDARFHA